MLAVNYSTIRKNFKYYCDKVNDDYETIIVTRKEDKNVVIISLSEYNNMIENLYLMSDKKNYDRLLESKKQIEKNSFIEKTTDELEAMENE